MSLRTSVEHLPHPQFPSTKEVLTDITHKARGAAKWVGEHPKQVALTALALYSAGSILINAARPQTPDDQSSLLNRVKTELLSGFADKAYADGGSGGMGMSIDGGRFYNETNGGTESSKGYTVTGPMWQVYEQMGRESVWGPPVSKTYKDQLGRLSQAFQRGIFQLSLDGSKVVKVEWANILDELSKQGKDDWLEAVKQTPKNPGWPQDTGKPWDQVVKNHLNLLDQNPAIKDVYLKDPAYIEKYGLPVAIEDYGMVVVIRAQRAVFQQWKADVPWAKAGDVTIGLGGDIAKEAGGIIPLDALALETYENQGPSTPPPQENPSAVFPREIGNLQRDGVVIYNKGISIGVVDNRTDPQNNWQAIIAAAKKVDPNSKYRFFFYDNPEDVPPPESLKSPYAYDPNWFWGNDFPGAGYGKSIRGQNDDGVWEWHRNLPFVKPEDKDKLTRNIVMQVLAFYYNKDSLFASQPQGYSSIIKQQALDPFNTGKMNFSLFVVENLTVK